MPDGIGLLEDIEIKQKILDFGAFTNWYEGNPYGRKTSYDKMCNLREALKGQDPLEFLHTLYYDQGKSLREILALEIIQEIDFISRATLHRLLFDHFGWIPRENTERTSVHARKLDEKVSGEIAIFETQVHELLHRRPRARIFQMSEFHQKRYRIEKALYILKTLGGIDKNMLFKLSVDGGLSNATLAKSLNNELESILASYPDLGIDFEDVKLYPQSIDRWFRYNMIKKDVSP